jgi:hypothetical protein
MSNETLVFITFPFDIIYYLKILILVFNHGNRRSHLDEVISPSTYCLQWGDGKGVPNPCNVEHLR